MFRFIYVWFNSKASILLKFYMLYYFTHFQNKWWFLEKTIDKDKRMRMIRLLEIWKQEQWDPVCSDLFPRRSQVLVGIMLHSCPNLWVCTLTYSCRCCLIYMWNVRRWPNLQWYRPFTQYVCKITDGPDPPVFPPTIATSELQGLPAFPPHKCHQTGKLAARLYPQSFVALPHPVLEQPGLENQTVKQSASDDFIPITLSSV